MPKGGVLGSVGWQSRDQVLNSTPRALQPPRITSPEQHITSATQAGHGDAGSGSHNWAGPDGGGTSVVGEERHGGGQNPEEFNGPYILPYQRQVANSYNSHSIQFCVAFIIFVNFLISLINAQILPPHRIETEQTEEVKSLEALFNFFELVFNLLFTIELVWNHWAHWFQPFWASGWNWFDFVIVTISWISFASTNSGISVLRLFRAFRVFRLFKRIEALRMIIDGVIASLPGVGHAFITLVILMGIWSIMGVAFFSDSGQVGGQHFGTFIDGVFTMFQTMSGDAWASAIARPLGLAGEEYGEEGDNKYVTWFFFLTYFFASGIVMMNVVVAILLDKYLAVTSQKDKEREFQHEEERRERQTQFFQSLENEVQIVQDKVNAMMAELKELKDKELKNNNNTTQTKT